MKGKNIIIGLGTSGTKVVERLMENRSLTNTFAMAFDNDVNSFSSMCDKVHYYNLSQNLTIGEMVELIEPETVSSFFPTDRKCYNVDAIYVTEMNHGAGGYRSKGLFSFIYYLFDPKNKDDFLASIDNFVNDETDVDYHLYVASSICGGTGSSLILALTFYLKKIFDEKYHISLPASALLALPSIYEEDASSREIKEKMFANAYATMQEINTVNEICNGNENMDFKLGSENDKIIGLLFDSSYPSSHTKEKAPFVDIYFFDRILGEYSIYTHEIEISNALYALISDLKIEKGKLASPLKCYKTLSTLEVNYPVEAIAHYVAGQSLLDIVNRELLYITNNVNEYIALEEKAAAESGRKLLHRDDKAKYANEYLDSLNGLFAQGRLDKSFANVSDVLLQRKDNEEFTYNMDFEKIISDYLKSFVGGKIDLVEESDSYQQIKEDFSFNNLKKIKPNHFFTKGETRQKRIELLKERTKFDYETLKKYYFKWVSSYRDQRTSFLASLLSLKEEDSEVSLLQNLLMEAGTFVHPSIAFLRLCSFSKLLERRVKRSALKEEEFLYIVENENEGIFHRFLRTKSEDMNRKSHYSMLGENRLGKYLIGREMIEKIYKINNSEVADFYPFFKEGLTIPYFDDIAFLNDCHEVVENINREIPLFYLHDMQILVKKLIDGYQAFFASLSSSSSLFEDEVKEDLKLGSESTKLFIYVGASVQNKKQAYNEYQKYVKEEKNHYKKTDAILGENVFAFVNSNKEEIENISKESSYQLLDQLKAIFLRRYMDSEAYANLKEKNVVSVLEDCLSSDNDYDDLYVYLVEASRINYKLSEDSPNYHWNPSYVSVSANTLKTLSDSLDNIEVLNEKMDELVSFDVDAYISEDLDDRSILFYKSAVDLSIQNFDHFHRENKEGYYPYYLKALELVKIYQTELWNPHLYKSKSGYADLSVIGKGE